MSCEPGRKKSWTKWSPGLPSFERSVSTDWFAAIRSRFAAAAAAAEAEAALALLLRRERDGQVGADVRERVERLFCARSRPFERLAIAITRATPSPRPISVTIVRVAPPHQLVPQVAEVEHGRSNSATPESALRNALEFPKFVAARRDCLSPVLGTSQRRSYPRVFHSAHGDPDESRVSAGRARALTAKTVLGAGASAPSRSSRCSRARAMRAGRHSGAGAGLRTPASFLASLQQGSDDDFGSGADRAAERPPQASTGTS